MKKGLDLCLLVLAAACRVDSPTTPVREARAYRDVAPIPSSAVHMWLGLKNSDDVGTQFDLLVEWLKNGQVMARDELDGVNGGSSGFNNASLQTIASTFDMETAFNSGDMLGIRLSVRIAEGGQGHRSGTARLWFNDGAANTNADIRVGTSADTFYLVRGFGLTSAPGGGPKIAFDVSVDRAVGGNPFKPFGTWQVVPSIPPRVIDVSTTNEWRTSVSETNSPMLAQWSDGALLVASLFPGTSYTVAASGGVATKTPFDHIGSRPSIWIPQGQPYPEIALGNYSTFRAQTRDNQTAWVNNDFGCCGAGVEGFPLDPAVGIQWRLKNRAQLDLRTGVTVGSLPFVDYAMPYITPDFTYEVELGQGTVIRTDRATNQDLVMALPTAQTGAITPGALTGAQGYLHVTAQLGGSVTYYLPTGQAWSVSVPSPGSPVVTGSGLAVVASSVPSGNVIHALNLADGSDAWSAPVAGTVNDIIVGDGGNLYVLLGSANTMLVFDAQTGTLRKTYVNVPTATEMILSSGTMYIIGPSELVAVAVESSGYDPNSPWPVRFGDNQRTSNLPPTRVP